jgi:hypothetical protein
MQDILLALSASLTLVATGTAQTIASETEWALLEQELATVQDLSGEPEGAVRIWGYLRTSYGHSDELIPAPGPGSLSGWLVDNLRLNVSGQTAGFEYRITGEAQSGRMTLEDAWASFALGPEITATLGRFKQPFLRSGTVEARDLLLIQRTRNGLFASVRDQGFMVNGDHGRFHWAAALQNGADGASDEWRTNLSMNLNLVGEAELPWEGAWKAGPGTRASLGLAVSDDSATSASGRVWAWSAYLVQGRFSLQAEWLHWGTGFNEATSPANPFFQQQVGATTPWSVTASYMLVPEKYELAVRFDNYDDEKAAGNFDRETFTVGVNRYIAGHDIKWQLNYIDASNSGDDAGSPSDGPHTKIIALGLTLSF